MLIEAKRVTLAYGGQVVLRDVDFSVVAGEIVTIIGPNGSGKSTLVRALVGALAPSSGQIVRKPGLRLGYVPQKLAIDATLPLTVGRFLGMPGRTSARDAAALLDRVGLPDISSAQMAGLSGGQAQRAMLARALRGEPQLLVLDEPTQALDQPGTADFYRLIEDVRRETGAAVLMVSHDLHVVMAASDRVVCLNGHVCCEGAPDVVSRAAEYRALFGHGTGGALALYRHEHDHHHDGHTHD